MAFVVTIDAEVVTVSLEVVVEAVQVVVEVVDMEVVGVVRAAFDCLKSAYLTGNRLIETVGLYLLVYSQLALFLF